jgi:hypothetical protein
MGFPGDEDPIANIPDPCPKCDGIMAKDFWGEWTCENCDFGIPAPEPEEKDYSSYDGPYPS